MTDEELFPHHGFPVRLEYMDGKDHKTCWFQSENHLEKHLTRYKLKPSETTIYRYGQQSEINSSTKPNRKSTKSSERKSVRGASKPKTRKSKDRTAEATQQPKKRGRPRKVRD
ncbi:hypothetical protein [Synechococcus phage DSL-LC03]|nr:hypothetical protein [Synechococcus phage DSL-LC03]